MSRSIVVNDKMQSGYEYYVTEPPGKNFSQDFKPELTPQQMLELGVFEGKYMRDCTREFPKDWFERAKFASGDEADPSKNYYEVSASQPLSVWQKNGWINPVDPRGWFQWYCRYYIGRRIPEYDAWQIKRWRAFARHIGQIKKNCPKGDASCRRRQRQALLHWAYDARKL